MKLPTWPALHLIGFGVTAALIACGTSTSAPSAAPDQSSGSAAGDRLIDVAPTTSAVQYGPITSLPSGGQGQTIRFVDSAGKQQGFGVRSYPAANARSPASWLSDRWDPGHLLSLGSCRSKRGSCILVESATRFMANAPVSQQDFPVLAVILTDTRALTIDRLNGITTPTDVILAVAGVSR